MENVFNTREIKINMSKEKILKNDMPFQFSHSILIFWNIGFLIEWTNNGSTNCNLSTLFFTNHFIDNSTNSVINSTHSEWWIEINYWKNWSLGDSVKISFVNQKVSKRIDELVSRWSVGRWRTCCWVGGQW